MKLERYKSVFEEDIKELNEGADGYAVILLGGSIASKSIRSLKHLAGVDAEDEMLTKEEAKNKAGRMNKLLSPGEKKYYGLKYVVAEIIDGKFTGK